MGREDPSDRHGCCPATCATRTREQSKAKGQCDLSPNCLPLHSGFSPYIPVVNHCTCLPVRSECLGALVCVIPQLSPLVAPLSPSCLPLHSPHHFPLVVSRYTMSLWILCPHDFRLVSPPSTLDALVRDFAIVSHWSPTTLGILCPHDSPTCTCVSHFLRISHFFGTCGLLVSDFASGRQQEFQISKY